MRPIQALTTCGLVVATVLTPVGAQASVGQPSSPSIDIDAPPSTLTARPSDQVRGDLPIGSIRWSRCPDDPSIQCGTIRVPMFWSNPARGTVTLALRKLSALPRATHAPSLFVNPGGPGASGTALVTDYAQAFRSLRAKYNIIGWDPRGVPTSRPLPRNCPTMAAPRETSPQTGAFSWSGAAASRFNLNAPRLTSCLTANPVTKLWVGTNEVVQDLDAMRQAVGDSKLSYLGYSYGTTIGKAYLQRYPSRVGRMVLDGVTDPANAWPQQLRGIERGARVGWQMLWDQLAPGVQDVYEAVVAHLQSQLISDGNTDIDRWTWWSLAINTARYFGAPELLSYYTCAVGSFISVTDPACDPYTRARLDPGQVLPQVRHIAEVAQSSPLLQLVDCGDMRNPLSRADVTALVARTAARSNPQVASDQLNFAMVCSGVKRAWDPLSALRRTRLANPPLLVNGVGDVATPYGGAVQTNRLLPGSRLVSVDTTIHAISLLNGSACVDAHVTKYLLRNRLPKHNVGCPGPSPT